jgi:hypothetical protein
MASGCGVELPLHLELARAASSVDHIWLSQSKSNIVDASLSSYGQTKQAGFMTVFFRPELKDVTKFEFYNTCACPPPRSPLHNMLPCVMGYHWYIAVTTSTT